MNAQTAADTVDVETRRVADRLRTLGPRWADHTEPGPAAEATAETVASVRLVLQRLADLAAQAEGRPSRAVPELGLHALTDQLLVLVTDVQSVAGTAGEQAMADTAEALTALRRSLP